VGNYDKTEWQTLKLHRNGLNFRFSKGIFIYESRAILTFLFSF
jgi:hypothetical protein